MEKFSNLVNVSLSSSGDYDGLVEAEKVNIEFGIDIDYQSWGINSFSFNILTKKTSIDVEVYMDDEDRTYTEAVEVDISKLKIVEEDATILTVTEVHLCLTFNLEVDYDNSYIEVVRPLPWTE